MLRNSNWLIVALVLWASNAKAQGIPSGPSPFNGTVTGVSIATANGFAGSVATPTTASVITLSTTATGILSGNGTSISAASTTGTGAVVLANTPTLITPVLGISTGTSLTLGGATIGSNAFAVTGTSALGATTVANFTASGATVIFNGLATDAAATDVTACIKSSDGTLLKGSGTLGICLGTSSARYKSGITDLTVGLNEIVALRAKSFYLDAAHGDPTKEMYGFTAEDCAKVLPKLVGFDNQNRPNTCDYLGIVPVLVRAIQQQQAEIDGLRGKK